MIIKGSDKINNYKFGDNQVDKIFKGEVQVFPDFIPSGEVVQTNITNGYYLSTGNDKFGRLYFGMQDNGSTYPSKGIYKIDDDGNVVQTNITTGQYRNFFIDNNGNLFAKCRDTDSYGKSKTYKLNYETNIFEYHSNIISNDNLSSCIGNNNVLYLSSHSHIYKYDSDKDEFIVIGDNGGDIIKSIKSNKIYIIGDIDLENGIWEIDESDDSIKKVLDSPDYSLKYLVQTNDLIYIQKGVREVVVFDESSKTIRNTNITDDEFTIAATDSNDIPYFGTRDKKGLYKLDTSTGNIIKTNLTETYIHCIRLASDNKLYIGTSYVYKVENNQVVQVKYFDNKYIVSPYCFGTNKDGTLYIGSAGFGIFKVVF